jgi:hypothetical protein
VAEQPGIGEPLAPDAAGWPPARCLSSITIRSQHNVTSSGALGFQCHAEVGVRTSLQCVDQRLPGLPTQETAKCVRRQNDRFFSPMYGYTLWPIRSRAAQHFTQPSLCVLQSPGVRLADRLVWRCAGAGWHQCCFQIWSV